MKKNLQSKGIVKLYSNKRTSGFAFDTYLFSKGKSYYIVKKYSNPISYSVDLIRNYYSENEKEIINKVEEILENVPEEEQDEMFELLEQAGTELDYFLDFFSSKRLNKNRKMSMRNFSSESVKEIEAELDKKIQDLKNEYSVLKREIELNERKPRAIALRNAAFKIMSSISYINKKYSEDEIKVMADVIAAKVNEAIEKKIELDPESYRGFTSKIEKHLEKIKKNEETEPLTRKALFKNIFRPILYLASGAYSIYLVITNGLALLAKGKLAFDSILGFFLFKFGPIALIIGALVILFMIVWSIANRLMLEKDAKRAQQELENVVLENLQSSEYKSLLQKAKELSYMDDKKVRAAALLISER